MFSFRVSCILCLIFKNYLHVRMHLLYIQIDSLFCLYTLIITYTYLYIYMYTPCFQYGCIFVTPFSVCIHIYTYIIVQTCHNVFVYVHVHLYLDKYVVSVFRIQIYIHIYVSHVCVCVIFLNMYILI